VHNPFFSLRNENYSEDDEYNANRASRRYPPRIELSSFGKGRRGPGSSAPEYNTDTLTTELGAEDREIEETTVSLRLPTPLMPSPAPATVEADAMSAYEASVQSAATFL